MHMFDADDLAVVRAIAQARFRGSAECRRKAQCAACRTLSSVVTYYMN
jgi:hypothetical protein